jgi:fructose-bisphosphate aldolase class I
MVSLLLDKTFAIHRGIRLLQGSTMNKMYKGKLPWHLSFSYGKALQKTCIVTWLGKEENKAAAQTALKNRSAANSRAVLGEYVAGTCASVGTDGNIKGAAGPY